MRNKGTVCIFILFGQYVPLSLRKPIHPRDMQPKCVVCDLEGSAARATYAGYNHAHTLPLHYFSFGLPFIAEYPRKSDYPPFGCVVHNT